ncbi:MAG: methane monooxygenase/ammonia monooxygenase subunit B [Nitrospiraceae bacterium]|jgi:methane/ammonia monooxygenase subunit B|uniref:methane monooxygenase/ammonia monooxygenase subunit B n=1 Tax=Nitrospira cf. moscoviensis SBR1015 TaxID=96242 RepID=UPI000A0DCE80|nr:methane monooxygenase/ammonia monooxygenase subunit B [Nitrospira cf. moscoviensis SBR1015]MBH0205169.1 methane monooxygenase/ammonia monooxygenase subunit B [Nitrospira sp.]MBY0248788.1 methane monooxygenase/ammonia monooxygenase subunit B [Nitrospiraceae bacterium]OQW37963.1 MAG: methane monooxygenase/ammonia monooxygenase subunit B [Nitrospira sp. SG-bin2]
MNAKKTFKLWMLGFCGIATLAVTPVFESTPAFAHGERSQEPFLRMRTVNWYDTEWVGKSTAINDVTYLRGKFHLSEDWPRAVVKPNRTFLNIGSPSSVFVRLSSKINGTPMFVSGPMEIGRDYAYEVTLKARLPGHHHIHPMFAVKDAGPIAGPGGWMDITGNAADFKNEIKTLTGETFDSETKGTATGVMWHLFWAAVAIAWVGFFAIRPMYLVRARVLAAYGDEILLDPIDRKVGIFFLVFTVTVVTVGYLSADAQYPVTVPLQAGEAKIKPMPIKPNPLVMEVTHAEYDVPGRALRMVVHATNNGTVPVTIGEFTTAGIRFTNKAGAAKLDPNYPAELVAASGLTMDNEAAIQPGQTVDIKIESKDVLWEVQRLVDILHDPDQRFAGLIMSYTDSGERLVNPVWAPVLPVFTRLGA